MASYAAALLAVYLGLAAMRLPPLQQGGTPALISYLAVLISAWIGGLGPGVLATTLLVLIALPPSLASAWWLLRLGVFAACGVGTSLLLEELHRGRRRAEAHATDLGRLIESIRDHAIFTTDRQGTITSWSPGAERVLGYSEAEAVGRGLSLFLDRGHAPITLAGLEGAAERDFACVRKDGTRLWASAAVSPLRGNGAGRQTWVLRDVTRRKHAEEALREAQRSAEAANVAKDDFLAVLSHELRTPLTPALVNVSSLLGETEIPESARPALEVVRRNILLEARLVDDLLDVTRIARGKLRLDRELVDVHELIRRAVEACRAEVDAAGLRLELDLAATERWVDADPARVQQVFWNLVKNAVKFTPVGGRILIRSCNEVSMVDGLRLCLLIVEVSDTGIGIAPETLPRIFRAFEQGDPSVTQRFGGLGLGLAISRGLVEAHGGRVSARSPGVGQGTTFRLELPTVPAGQPSLPTAPELAPEPPTEPLRILLVEDNVDTLRAVTHLLRRRGHQVTPAATIAAASAAVAADDPFDLVISDVGLPDGSGLDLMRQVRSQYPALGIALSGYGQDEDLRKSREAGFRLHLTKPVDFSTLEAAIRQVTLSETDSGPGEPLPEPYGANSCG